MKTKLFTFSAIAAAFIASHASAAIVPYDDFLDLEIIDELVTPTLPGSFGGMSGVLDVTGTVDLAPDIYDLKYDKQGFLPDSYTVTNVALAFSFYKWDDQNSKIWAMVDIDLNLGDAGPVSRGADDSLESGGFSEDPFEFNFVLDTTPVSGPSALSEEVAVKLIADVQADGMISWGVDVGAAEGIYLFGAALGVEAVRVSDNGSTMALLGAGFLGLAMIRRRTR